MDESFSSVVLVDGPADRYPSDNADHRRGRSRDRGGHAGRGYAGRSYEKVHGRIARGAFLQALVRDPALAWVAPLTSLIARFDELDEGTDAQRRTWRARARALLDVRGRGEFATKYAERIQLSADVAYAHAAAMMRSLARVRMAASATMAPGHLGGGLQA